MPGPFWARLTPSDLFNSKMALWRPRGCQLERIPSTGEELEKRTTRWDEKTNIVDKKTTKLDGQADSLQKKF